MNDKNVRTNDDEEFEIDISKLSDEVKTVISEQLSENIEKNVSISFDGKQFLCRFPMDISKAIRMKKGDKIHIKVKLYHPDLNKEEDVEIKYERS